MTKRIARQWRTLLAVATGVALSSLLAGCGSPSPAQKIMSKIPGCSGISTSGGSSLDDNTVSEGGCTLDDGTNLSIYVWAAGDVSDLEQYMYLSSNPGYCCIVGSKPMPWAISLDTSAYAPSYAAGLWSSVERALRGAAVTSVPASWQYGLGTLPTPASSSASPSPSPTSTPAKARSHRAHHIRPAAPNPPSPVPSPTPAPPAPSPASGAWCTANAVWNVTYSDYDVYVHSNQPEQDVTASASNGVSMTYYTDNTGYADVYLYADPGDSITVQVGSATCSATGG
jgi:hypothetical protein